MIEIKTRIAKFISSQALPENTIDFLEGFLSGDQSTFEAQETSLWDYKAEFPYSHSDAYFAGIVRLICGMFNSYGGVIIFGVHDKTRKPGCNSVKINIERLNSALREILTTPIECVHRSYVCGSDPRNKIDVLLVPKRPFAVPPVSIVRNLPDAIHGAIYLRRNHEVLAASSADLTFLYGNRQSFGDAAEQQNEDPIESALPANPSTIKEFIGRFSIMERLWRWLVAGDEPRTFVFGKGGSGKSTLAYEFARIVAQQGKGLVTSAGKNIDQVIYVTAKAQQLESITSKVTKTTFQDFSNAHELFRAILALANWLNLDQTEELSDSQLIKEIEQLLEIQHLLIVIDDVDTLTTKGIDAGMDALYRVSIKSKMGAKLLYTLRNAPGQSLANAVEVPGLEPGVEFPNFVNACCKQFRQPEPVLKELSEIGRVSERRPLVVETIIGLRRTAGSYGAALALFSERAGDDARRYLFQREYDALPGDNRSRLLLAAIACFDRPITSDELEAVLNFDKQQLNDAIADVAEMFLARDNSQGPETRYSIGAVTKAFIDAVSPRLNLYSSVRERVNALRRSMHPQLKEITLIRLKAERHLKHNDRAQAWILVNDPTLPPKITEHPEFASLKGLVAANQLPPLFEETRQTLRYAQKMGVINPAAMRSWFYVEWSSGNGLPVAIEVCDAVLNAKVTNTALRAEFLGKKGYALLLTAQQHRNIDTDLCLNSYKEALFYELQSYLLASASPGLDPEKSRQRILKCLDEYAVTCANADRVSDFFDALAEIGHKPGVEFDILADPLLEVFRTFARTPDPKNRQRLMGALSRIANMEKGSKSIAFAFSDTKTRFFKGAADIHERLRDSQQRK